ncbi:ATP-binding region ATPase domain protein [Streptomyces iranensis]|nr:ATP-binding region ATPase domain protein [Streptomyces iranensis]
MTTADSGTRMWTLPRLPPSVPAARRLVDALLQTWKCPLGTVEIAQLVVTELLTNAVRHADGPRIVCNVSLAPGVLMLSVTDTGNRAADDAAATPATEPASLEESGRGPAVVTALATDWGARCTPCGHEVWARLAG